MINSCKVKVLFCLTLTLCSAVSSLSCSTALLAWRTLLLQYTSITTAATLHLHPETQVYIHLIIIILLELSNERIIRSDRWWLYVTSRVHRSLCRAQMYLFQRGRDGVQFLEAFISQWDVKPLYPPTHTHTHTHVRAHTHTQTERHTRAHAHTHCWTLQSSCDVVEFEVTSTVPEMSWKFSSIWFHSGGHGTSLECV